MNCKKISKATAQGFYDDALTAQEKAQIKKHLLVCSWCRIEVERWRALSGILQQDTTPMPPASFDNKVLEDYRRKYVATEKSAAWWQKVLVSPTLIPKQVFAASLVITAIFGIKYLMPRNEITNPVETATSFKTVEVPAVRQPETIVPKKIIEAPVKQMATKVDYLTREKSTALKNVKKRTTAKRGPVNQKPQNQAADVDYSSFPLSGSIAQNGYFTPVNLKEFQPAEMRTRIIREAKTGEK